MFDGLLRPVKAVRPVTAVRPLRLRRRPSAAQMEAAWRFARSCAARERMGEADAPAAGRGIVA